MRKSNVFNMYDSYNFLTRYFGITSVKMVGFGRSTHEMTSTEGVEHAEHSLNLLFL